MPSSGRAPARRGRDRDREEPRVPDPGAPSGSASSSPRRRRRSRSSCSRRTCRAAAALGREVDGAVLKGRQNYLCRQEPRSSVRLRARPARRRGRLRAPAAAGSRRRRPATGPSSPFEPRPTLWTELAVGADRCLGRRRCPGRHLLLRAGRARAAGGRARDREPRALLRRPRAAGGDGAGVLPEHDAVVFDEAHRLEEAAASWFGGRLSVAAVRRLRDVERAAASGGAGPPRRRLAIDRRGRGPLLDRSAAAPAPARPPRGRVDARAGLVADRRAGSRAERGGGGARRARRARSQSATTSSACLERPTPNLVSWTEPGALAWAPVDVSTSSASSSGSGGSTAVLVSATLEPRFVRGGSGSTTRARSRGRRRSTSRSRRCSTSRAFPSRATGYDARLAEEVVELCRLSAGGRSSSRRRIARSTSSRSGPRRASRTRCSSRARRRASGCSSASATRSTRSSSRPQTFWQGVDVRGESLSLLVIDKLPFAAPGDPLVEARCERIAAGGDWFREYACRRRSCSCARGSAG